MTLDEDNIPVDEDSTQRFVRSDASNTQSKFDDFDAADDPWKQLEAALKKMGAEGSNIHFRLDEAYTRKVLDYAIDSRRVHFPQILVDNYSLLKRVIPIWSD